MGKIYSCSTDEQIKNRGYEILETIENVHYGKLHKVLHKNSE
jgi:hypothetical protein